MAAAHGQSVSENYADGRMALICDLDISLPSGEFGRVRPSGSPLRKFKHGATLVFVANVPNPLKLHMGDEQPVLVLNVESVQGPDAFSIPALVGLYDIHDEVNDPFGGLTYESAIDDGYKFIPSVAYRKLSVLRPLSCGQEFDFVRDKIESGAQIVHSVSGDAHEFFRHGFTKLDVERIVAGINVSLNVNSVGVSLEAHQKTKQLLDVPFGPLDL